MASQAQQAMLDKLKTQTGFIAALDQSGGSTPKALRLYGIEESEYSSDEVQLYSQGEGGAPSPLARSRVTRGGPVAAAENQNNAPSVLIDAESPRINSNAAA